MKKILLVILILTVISSFTSCASVYEKVTGSLMEKIPTGNHYSSEQIENVQATHDKHEHFEGKILSMADFSTIDADGNNIYIYVYEFELKSDAEKWYDMVKAGWAYARTKGNVVIYGTDSIIEDIKL